MWVPHENILTWKFLQLHIIEITVHILPIITSYLAIATSLHVLQRYLSAIRFHAHSIQTPSKIQSSVTRPLQCQCCYPGTAIGDKDSHKSYSQSIKPCASFSFHACQWLQWLQLTMNTISFCRTITTELGLCGFTWRQTAITRSLLKI